MSSKKAITFITITRWCRHAYLQNLYTQIVAQKGLQNVNSEWLIVDASPLDDDQKRLQSFVEQHLQRPNTVLKSVYVSTLDIPPGLRVIGKMRELSNSLAKGDYMIAMDDDDYYPTTRMKSALQALKKCHLAACTNHIMADYDTGLVFQIKGFHERHGVNCTMAYTRHYATTHHYDESRTHGEESSFTNQFREAMVQLDPMDTIVQTSHPGNTFNKRRFILKMMQGDTDTGRVLSMDAGKIVSSSFRAQMIPSYTKSGHHTVFYCGYTDYVWDPKTISLPGLQMLVQLAYSMAKQVDGIAVYGNFSFSSMKYQGVDFVHVDQFLFRCQYKHLILWHSLALAALKSPFLKAETISIDIYGNGDDDCEISTFVDWLEVSQIAAQVHCVFVRTEKQKEELESKISTTPHIQVIKHGIAYINDQDIEREPDQFVYADPTGYGLVPILEMTWPILQRLRPTSTLHICYDFDYAGPEIKARLESLTKQPGIILHGAMEHEDVLRLKHLVRFHLLFAPICFPGQELMWIQESILAGCVPIMSKSSVTEGKRCPEIIELDLEFKKVSYVSLARELEKLMNGQDHVQSTHTTWKQEQSWDRIAIQYLDSLRTSLEM